MYGRPYAIMPYGDYFKQAAAVVVASGLPDNQPFINQFIGFLWRR